MDAETPSLFPERPQRTRGGRAAGPRSSVVRRERSLVYAFVPVRAIPSINCFWTNRYSTSIGTIAKAEPAIITG